MRKFVLVLMAGLFATSAYAADATCEAKAAEKKLAGAAKTSFVKKCEADAKAAAPKSCEAQAADKKLAGAAKTSFVKKCETDAKGATPAKAEAAPAKAAAAPAKGADAQKTCEAKAAEKKLAGAAKNSFVKKCVTDASK